MKIYVKHMACESCKLFVRGALHELGVRPINVELGKIVTNDDLSDEDKRKLDAMMRKGGMELLDEKETALIEKIRACMTTHVSELYNSNQSMKFSVWLSQELDLEYTYLANLFATVEAITLQKYITALKIEKIKEMIISKDYTFSEIAHNLNFSNVAHLANEFKRATGLTPSHFKALKEKRWVTIQSAI